MTVATNKERDAAVQGVSERHLLSPSATLRQDAALASGLVRWRALQPALAAAFAIERDSRVRTTPAFVLDPIAQSEQSRRKARR